MERMSRRGSYQHGLVCGLLMSAVAYAMRGWDAPGPLFAALLCTPYCVIPGYLFARRSEIWLGALAGALVAATGHVIVFLTAVGVAATVWPWPQPLLWLLGLLFVPITAILGIFFGRLGATFARHYGLTSGDVRAALLGRRS
jgi:hypothetical protein